MKAKKTTMSKVFDIANSRSVEGYEPKVYMEFEVSNEDIKILSTIFTITMRGIEVDISEAVKKEFLRPVNSGKRKQLLGSLIDEFIEDNPLSKLANMEEDEMD